MADDEFDANAAATSVDVYAGGEECSLPPGRARAGELRSAKQLPRAITGQAVPSWGPQLPLPSEKLDCFCFKQQTLQPGEVRRMPVAFVIEKTLPDDVNYVTMSYTFFAVEGRASNVSNGRDG